MVDALGPGLVISDLAAKAHRLLTHSPAHSNSILIQGALG